MSKNKNTGKSQNQAKTTGSENKIRNILLTIGKFAITLAVIWAVMYIQNNYLSPSNQPDPTPQPDPAPVQQVIDEDGIYTSKDDVALYIHTYNKLPKNFITKSEARKLGWESGGLDKYVKNGCIGGDVFGNKEGLLPKAKGRVWYECDIDTLHKNSRGSKRIVFSNDGLIYYTSDHYESFKEITFGD